MNGIPLINGIEYSWGDIVCTIAGTPVTGITGIEYSDEQEVTDNYGAGRYPVSRSKGRITCSGKITLYASEVNALVKKSANGRLQDIAAFDIIVSYIPDQGGVVIHDKLRNCQFKKNERSWSEGDTSKAVDLDLAVSHIEWGK
jgi:polyribonucleotide nucleotidyltransferase